MLVIRKEQIAVLGEHLRRRWWFERARRSWPECFAQLGPAAFRERVERAADRAKSGGIETADEIERFIDLAFLWGEVFDTPDRTPWVERILGWEEVASKQKIAALLHESEQAQDRLWLEEQRRSEGA